MLKYSFLFDLKSSIFGIKIFLYFFILFFQSTADPTEAFIKITVTSPQKVGEGIGAYVAYKVETRTNMPIFRKRTFCVSRRFSDFLGLHDKLTDKYLRNGRIIPPAPEKNALGNFVESTCRRKTNRKFAELKNLLVECFF